MATQTWSIKDQLDVWAFLHEWQDGAKVSLPTKVKYVKQYSDLAKTSNDWIFNSLSGSTAMAPI